MQGIESKTEDIAWLTGLRGYAAVIVAITHLIEGQLNAGFRGYLANPPEHNRYFFQLPPVRLLFAGQGMVALFFVISAYSISIRPLHFRENMPRTSVLQYLSSAVFRRGIRLYLPTFAMEVIAHVAMMLGLYHWEDHKKLHIDSIWQHFTALGGYMLAAIDPLANDSAPSLNGQLWTIPLEFLGSSIVYLTIIGTLNVRRSIRPAIAILGAVLGFWNLHWLLLTYMSGLAIAEIHLLLEERDSTSCRSLTDKLGRYPRFFNVGNNLMLFCGLYLLCLPEQPKDNMFSEDYSFLKSIRESPLHDDEVIAQTWRGFGGALCVFSISNSRTLQAPFGLAIAQTLGKRSFGLYLVHLMVYQMWLFPLLKFFGSLVQADSSAAPWLAWGGSAFVLAPVIWFAAKVFTWMVDEKSVEFSRWVEAELQ